MSRRRESGASRKPPRANSGSVPTHANPGSVQAESATCSRTTYLPPVCSKAHVRNPNATKLDRWRRALVYSSEGLVFPTNLTILNCNGRSPAYAALSTLLNLTRRDAPSQNRGGSKLWVDMQVGQEATMDWPGTVGGVPASLT